MAIDSLQLVYSVYATALRTNIAVHSACVTLSAEAYTPTVRGKLAQAKVRAPNEARTLLFAFPQRLKVSAPLGTGGFDQFNELAAQTMRIISSGGFRLLSDLRW